MHIYISAATIFLYCETKSAGLIAAISLLDWRGLQIITLHRRTIGIERD
jgi:hypothetical protein